MVSSHIFINSSFALSGARTGLGICGGSLEVDVSGFLTAIDPSANPNGCGLDERRIADDSPGFALSE